MPLYVNGELITDERLYGSDDPAMAGVEEAFLRLFAEHFGFGLIASMAIKDPVDRVLIEQVGQKHLARLCLGDAKMAAATRHQEEAMMKALPAALREPVRQLWRRRVATLVYLSEQGLPKFKAPTDDELQAFYRTHLWQFATGAQVHAAHLVKHVGKGANAPAQARTAMAAAHQELCGGADFATVAKKYSDCPENGGDLGFIARGQMVEAFDDVVFGLAAGEFSEPFETEFGWHVAKAIAFRPSTVLPFAAAKENVLVAHTRAQIGQWLPAHVAELRAKATIEERPA